MASSGGFAKGYKEDRLTYTYYVIPGLGRATDLLVLGGGLYFQGKG